MATKSRARSRSPIMKEGDWICSGCKGHNYSRRTDCFKCKLSKTFSERNSNRGKVVQNEGDQWDCLNCGYNNFAKRTQCYKCHGPKVERGQNQSGSTPLFNQKVRNDWWCHDCNINNFAKNTMCFRCKRPKDECVNQDPPKRGMMANNMKQFHQEDTCDWICNSCGVHNGYKRDHCYKCEKTRRKPNNQRPGNRDNFDLRSNINEPNNEQKHHFPMKPGDWTCGQCGQHNFAKRNACFKCKTDKEEATADDNFAVTFDCDRPGPSNLNTMMLNHSMNNRLGPKHNAPLMETPGEVRRRSGSGNMNFGGPIKRQRRTSFDDGRQNHGGMSPSRPSIRTAYYEQPHAGDFPADWTCGNCDTENFAKRNTCLKCNNDRRDCEVILGNMGSMMGRDDRRPGPLIMNEGKSDYICQECGTHNHFNNSNCKKCNRPNPKVGRSGSGPVMSDWHCRDCDCSNFARRSSCFKCGQSRIQCELREVRIMNNIIQKVDRMQGRKEEREGDGWFCDQCDNCNDPVNFKCRRCGAYRAGDDVDMRGVKGSSQPPLLQVWQQQPCSPPRNFSPPRNNFSPPRNNFSPPRNNFSPPRNNFRNDPPHNRGRSLNNNRSNNRYVTPPPKRGGPRPGLVDPNLHQDKRFDPDWECKNCNINNFVKRKECFRCKQSKDECERKKDKHGVPIGPNDWLCDKCGENNFSRRTQCFKCGTSRVKDIDDLQAPDITIEG